jgi:hypothetical protein
VRVTVHVLAMIITDSASNWLHLGTGDDTTRPAGGPPAAAAATEYGYSHLASGPLHGQAVRRGSGGARELLLQERQPCGLVVGGSAHAAGIGDCRSLESTQIQCVLTWISD